MRVSQLFGLSGNQGTFDFLDVNVDGDTPLFIDPAVLSTINSPWAAACTSTVQDFFSTVLEHISKAETTDAQALMQYLQEENATHLGYSSRSQGSGVGPGLASRFFKELSASKAASSGLLRDLEDTAILVEGVREDRISDVTTNLIRRQLVEYTQSTAAYYAIPLQENVAVRPFWDAVTSSWKQAVFDLPVTDAGPLILVPKAIVRRSLFFDPGKYYRHYVLNFFVERELEDPKSPLVYLLKSGQRRVRKKDVEAKVRKRNTGTAGPGIESELTSTAHRSIRTF